MHIITTYQYYGEKLACMRVNGSRIQIFWGRPNIRGTSRRRKFAVGKTLGVLLQTNNDKANPPNVNFKFNKRTFLVK